MNHLQHGDLDLENGMKQKALMTAGFRGLVHKGDSEIDFFSLALSQ